MRDEQELKRRLEYARTMCEQAERNLRCCVDGAKEYDNVRYWSYMSGYWCGRIEILEEVLK